MYGPSAIVPGFRITERVIQYNCRRRQRSAVLLTATPEVNGEERILCHRKPKPLNRSPEIRRFDGVRETTLFFSEVRIQFSPGRILTLRRQGIPQDVSRRLEKLMFITNLSPKTVKILPKNSPENAQHWGGSKQPLVAILSP